MCLWSKNKIVTYDRPFYYFFQNNTVSYCTLLPCYIPLLPWHPTCALGQKLQCVKPWQTMLPWHLLLCLFYMRISVSNVTLSVPCYRMHARVITFLPVFPWRVTYFKNKAQDEILILIVRKSKQPKVSLTWHLDLADCNEKRWSTCTM